MLNKKLRLVVGLTLVGVLSMGIETAVAQEHEHGHGHHHGQTGACEAGEPLALNQGKKWMIDDNVRLGMTHIRDAIAKDMHAIHSGKQTAQAYTALAKKVEGEIDSIIASCKLEPDSDAMLHRLLARVLSGSERMAQGKSDQERHKGVECIVRALADYGTYFDHPGWQGLE